MKWVVNISSVSDRLKTEQENIISVMEIREEREKSCLTQSRDLSAHLWKP